MFRKLRRFKQELSTDDCKTLLKTEKRAVLAVNGDNGYPYAVPINFYYNEKNNKIYIHTAKDGHKIDSIIINDKVCFTVYEKGVQSSGDWSYFVKSVIIFGRAKLVSDEDFKYEMAKKFGLKYYPSEQEVDFELQKDFWRLNMIEITPEHMCGKIVHEK